MNRSFSARSRSYRGLPCPVLYGLLALVAIGASSTATAQSGPDLVQRLDSIAGAGVRENRAVGIVAAVVKGNDTLLLKAYGKAVVETDSPATVDTVFQIGSDTKQFTAAAILQLRDQGKLTLDVRAATERFRNVRTLDEANREGYSLLFGCVSGGDFGAMGLHFTNLSLVGDGEVDVTQPEIVLYEPTPNGGVRLTGADFLVIKADWDAKHSSPPELMGQLFHLFDSPNRFGLPAFYTLHVWAWKDLRVRDRRSRPPHPREAFEPPTRQRISSMI